MEISWAKATLALFILFITSSLPMEILHLYSSQTQLWSPHQTQTLPPVPEN